MRFRNGFVSNSSSCSFVIKNQTGDTKNMEDFALETGHLVKEFNKEYDWNNHTLSEFMSNIDDYQIEWEPGETKVVIFGDEDGTIMGKVYDYMLRESDYSNSFSWHLKEMLR